MCIRDRAKAALRVEMEFTGRCWIERVIDEGDRLSELRVAGEALTLEGERSIVLTLGAVSYTHLRAHETVLDLVCRLLLEKKNQRGPQTNTVSTVDHL